MTGLWQVFGSARIPMNEMVKIDYLYGANWSLWLDVKILLRTVPFVLGRRGLCRLAKVAPRRAVLRAWRRIGAH